MAQVTFTELNSLKKIANLVEGKLRTYSGRGMMGKECYGITVGPAQLVDTIEEAAINGIRGARYDNMGRDIIVYWPDIQYNPNLSIEEDEEEEDEVYDDEGDHDYSMNA